MKQQTVLVICDHASKCAYVCLHKEPHTATLRNIGKRIYRCNINFDECLAFPKVRCLEIKGKKL